MVFYLGSWTRVKYEVTAQCISLIPGNWITRAWERRYSWDEITEVYVQEMEFTRKPGRKRTFPDKKYIIIKKNRLTIPPEKRRYILFWKMEKNAICIPWNEDLQNYINGKTR